MVVKEVEKRKEIAVKAALEAGKMLKENFGRISGIKTKSDRNLVTDLDLKADEIITNIIKKAFKDDNILSEERDIPELTAEYTWIIDPIDGTHNFIRSIDIFGVSVGIAQGDKVIAGVIYMPISGELYSAVKGKSAYCNGNEINVSNKDLSSSTLIFDSTIHYNRDAMLTSLGSLADKVFNVRMLGSTVRGLGYVADGKADLEVEYNDKVWDFAAGLLIIEEAGGKVTDLEGKEWNIKTQGYVASNGVMHDEVIRIING